MEKKKETLTNEELQTKLLKRMCVMDTIRTAACILVAVMLIGTSAVLLPRLYTTLNQANVALTELTLVTEELSRVDFISMSNGIIGLARVGTESLSTATEELTATLNGLQEIDFAMLNDSIENLSSVTSRLARIANIFG